MSAGNPKVDVRLKPQHLQQIKAYVANSKGKYTDVSSLIRQLLKEKLESEGYQLER